MGGESGIDVFLYENDDDGSHVPCEKCGASIGLAFFPLTKEEAIEAWNKRVGEVTEMTDKKLTARKAIAIHNEAQKAKLKGAIEYKRYLKQVIDDYGIEKNDAFRLAMGENLLQIVAKYEVAE